MKSASIGRRLSVSFGSVCLLLLIVLTVGIYNLTELRNQLSRASASSHRVELGSEMGSALLNVVVITHAAIANAMDQGAEAQDLKRLASAERALESAEGGYRKLEHSRQLSDRERRLLKHIISDRAKLTPLTGKIVTSLKSFMQHSAQSVLNEKLMPAVKQVGDDIGALTSLENDTIRAASIQAGVRYRNALKQLLAVSILALVLSIVMGIRVTRSITTPLRGAVEAARQVAAGDLTISLVPRRKDESGQLLASLQEMAKQLSLTVGNVRQGAGETKATAGQLAEAANELRGSAHRQAEAASATATAMEQVSVSIAGVAEAAAQLRERSEESLTATQDGSSRLSELMRDMQSVQQVVHETTSSIKGFVQHTHEIAAMTREVKDIAEQTNRLALNAAIEAARAGEAGRGFAVVAGEVRSLAEKSAHSASTIEQITQRMDRQSSLVDEIAARGERALSASENAVNSVAQALELSSKAVDQSNKGVDGIVYAVNEQKTGVDEIARLMDQVASMVENNRLTVDSATGVIEDMDALAGRLQATVETFRV